MSLCVYLRTHLIGHLEEDVQGLRFTYVPEWVEAQGEPLSFSLPLRRESYVGVEVESFFSNLLPDDYVRTRIGEILQIPRENTYALLEAIGGDCAGAVQFFKEGTDPQFSREPVFRALSETEALKILADLEKRPLNVGEDGVRISGAGAQDKLVACVKGGEILLPLNGTPSTHIIKPEIKGYPGSVENEWFSMCLAAKCGLKTAACTILKLGESRYYVTERYDRMSEDGSVVRLHQEDFCQLLNVDPKHKYEAHGGPGLASCFELLRRLQLSAAETLEFLNRVIFNFLVGNGDAHGKNFSVLYRNGRCELAPMYDVMSTTIYPEVAARMAMKIDGEYGFKWMTLNKFIRQGEKLGFSEKLMRSVITKLSKRVLKESRRLADQAKKRYPSWVYDSIVDGIEHRVELLKSGLSPEF